MNERAWLARLRGKYVEYATLYFGGALPIIPIVLSYRMRKKVAEVETTGGKPTNLVVSARHIQTHGWKAAQETLLHEMLHVAQAARGLPMHHDRYFRGEAQRLGINASAKEYIKPLKRCHLK